MITMDQLLPSQSEALQHLRELVNTPLRRPTFLLTGGGGVGKSTVARLLAQVTGGRYWNFTLEGLTELFERQNPLHLQVSRLVRMIVAGVTDTPGDLVVLDGLEPALTGLLPLRRGDLHSFLSTLQTLDTGKRLCVVLTSGAGSPFLTPGELEGLWTESDKLITLAFTSVDGRALGARLAIAADQAELAPHLYAVLAQAKPLAQAETTRSAPV